MFNLVERYINNMNINDVNRFATSKNINLSEDELTFTYNFIKKNYKDFFKNPQVFSLDRYKDNYSKENFIKIDKVYKEYKNKYYKFL